MLSGTNEAPPQLDEFFLSEDRAQRKADLERMGFPRLLWNT